MRIHETRTQLTPDQVIDRARAFFTLSSSSYAAFQEQVGDGYLKLFMEVGEIVIGTVPRDGYTLVRGSASRGEHILTKFLVTLSPSLEPRQALHRYGRHEVHGALVANTQAALEPGPDEDDGDLPTV